MPLYSTLAGLSQTPASNAPDGTIDAPSTIDDQLRYLGSFVALLRDGKPGVAEATVASAATADIGGANSPFVQITGTTTITSFGTNYNGPRFLRFSGALTLTHNASTLILPGGANITTAAGDTCTAIPISGGWYVERYTRASTPINGAVVDRTYVEYTANASLTTSIPQDDTIPQNTEGTQIISASFTPKSATNRIRLRFSGSFALSGAGTGIVALFSSASSNAIAVAAKAAVTVDAQENISVQYEYVPGTTSALTFSVRAGSNGAATMRFNGSTTARQFGGVQSATLVIEEIAA